MKINNSSIELVEDELCSSIEPEDLRDFVQLGDDVMTLEEKSKVFTIRLESQFIPTPTMIKQRLGLGYKVLAVEVEKEASITITNVDNATDAMIKTGYRALVRANHPDLGGNSEVMVILNRAKKEIDDLLKEVRG